MKTSYRLVDPDSRLNWSFDWSDALGEGDAIAGHSWAIAPAGPTLSGESTDTVYVSDLAPGSIYRLADTVVTQSGVQMTRSITLRADDR
jgi:hypothetical protein